MSDMPIPEPDLDETSEQRRQRYFLKAADAEARAASALDPETGKAWLSLAREWTELANGVRPDS